jgi:tRNA pseudouridine32 synthase
MSSFTILVPIECQDENEDWSRWRDVVFRAKGRLTPVGIERAPLPPQNRRKRGGPDNKKVTMKGRSEEERVPDALTPLAAESESDAEFLLPLQLTTEEALAKVILIDSPPPTASPVPQQASDCVPNHCPECYLPLHPDPHPENLYIFLHALRYTTSLGRFETEMPDWAAEGYGIGGSG